MQLICQVKEYSFFWSKYTDKVSKVKSQSLVLKRHQSKRKLANKIAPINSLSIHKQNFHKQFTNSGEIMAKLM